MTLALSRWWSETAHFRLTADGVLYQVTTPADPDLDRDEELFRVGDVFAGWIPYAIPGPLHAEFEHLRAEYRDAVASARAERREREHGYRYAQLGSRS